jgi:hypothetical protein
MVRKAYTQGDLDGFCGIYATVNAIRLIDRRMRGEQVRRFIRKDSQVPGEKKKHSELHRH